MRPLLRAVAERQHGLVTATDARRAGYGEPEIRHLCSSGRWVRVRRGVYVPAVVLAVHEDDGGRHLGDAVAVLLAIDRPTAALSHGPAVRLRGLPVARDPDASVRLTGPLQWRRGRGHLVTAAPLSAADVTTAGPLRVTSTSRSLVDVAREWPLETRGRLRLVGAGLPCPELQVEIRAEGRLVAAGPRHPGGRHRRHGPGRRVAPRGGAASDTAHDARTRPPAVHGRPRATRSTPGRLGVTGE